MSAVKRDAQDGRALAPAAKKRQAHHAFRLARWHRETVLSALDELRHSLMLLPDELLSDLVRRGYGSVYPDGFRSTPVGERVNGTGGDVTYRGVEMMVERRVSELPPPDPAGVALRDLFDTLHRMSNMAADIDRLVPFLVNLHDQARGRQSASSGDCLVCDCDVSGSEGDRMKRGMCKRCYDRWYDRGRPDVIQFIGSERARLAAIVDRGDDPVTALQSVVTGGFRRGAGEVVGLNPQVREGGLT